jgi:hypothetical protein
LIRRLPHHQIHDQLKPEFPKFTNFEFNFYAPQHFLNFLPEPHGHGSLRPAFNAVCKLLARLVSFEASMRQ